MPILYRTLSRWQTAATSATTAQSSLYNTYQFVTAQATYTATSTSSSAIWWSAYAANDHYWQLQQQQEHTALQAHYMAMLARQDDCDPPAVRQPRDDLTDQQREVRQGNRRIAESARRQAIDRSRQLLLSHLSEEQRLTFERNGWFVVEGGNSKQRYRIRSAVHLVGNVDVLENDLLGTRVLYRLCAHCAHGTVPLFDQLLAQKVTLELDEASFLRVANRHGA